MIGAPSYSYDIYLLCYSSTKAINTTIAYRIYKNGQPWVDTVATTPTKLKQVESYLEAMWHALEQVVEDKPADVDVAITVHHPETNPSTFASNIQGSICATLSLFKRTEGKVHTLSDVEVKKEMVKLTKKTKQKYVDTKIEIALNLRDLRKTGRVDLTVATTQVDHLSFKLLWKDIKRYWDESKKGNPDVVITSKDEKTASYAFTQLVEFDNG